MKKKNKRILKALSIELVKLQKTTITSNQKVVVIIEGRDTAGKDGVIKTIIKHLSPRETRVVALTKPSDRQKCEWFFQRYAAHLPAEGEMVLFNRSWYNRAGVEKIMGFCQEKEYKRFFPEVALFEKMLASAGFTVIKYYLDISKKEQKGRLDDRESNPLKQWKLSPIDKEAQKHWEAYSEARDIMLSKTNFRYAPWHIVNAEDKKAARIAVITHLLRALKYNKKDDEIINKHTKGLVYPATKKNITEKCYS